MNRLAMLEEFVAKNPKDPFPRYGLAMELRNAGRLDEARTRFAEVMKEFPDYTASYLHYGNLLVKMGEKAEAAEVMRAGIAACERKNDGHALGELESALSEIT
jgi:predicted Zn-dependent protease